MTDPHVLLTNDDGIDAPGLAALYEELRAVADVTVVAPADNQSGVGRARSRAVDVDDHEWGYAVDGTPADCAAYGLGALEPDVDLVVSGCNHGPNCGEYLMGHSGTVGAAVEAAYLGTPAIAVSAYHREEFFPPDGLDFDVPAAITRELTARCLDAGAFDAVDYLSVNAPVEAHGALRITEPLADYAVGVRESDADERESYGGDWRLVDDYWARLEQPGRYPTLGEAAGTYPDWSDRAAVVDGDVSVSPMCVPQEAVRADAVEDLVAACDGALAGVAAGDD